MSDGANGATAQPTVAQVIEIAIRWVPQTGQLQVVGSPVDDVTKLGMLEMAKVALLRQNQQMPQPSLIVPGRFSS